MARHWRDAVSDTGDPYLVSWILWWDFHATFTDPLNLFHSNTFYPYRYTLAFSEHSYGLAAIFFPLFALGARPLTVHVLATLLGFTLCGYGMFRLARTLTGSRGVAWVAGIAFAFVPFRFDLLPHLMYLFAGWVPLLLEALVLFARERSRRRAVWLGVAFLMNALTCFHWFVLTLIPLGAATAILLTRYGLWRDRDFWRRGTAAVGAASLLLVPFLIPYVRASQLYGFTRAIREVEALSPRPAHWLAGVARNKLWAGFGARFMEGSVHWPLFPGLLLLLLPLASMLVAAPPPARASDDDQATGEDGNPIRTTDNSSHATDNSARTDDESRRTGDELRRTGDESARKSDEPARGAAGGGLTRRRRAVVLGLDLLILALVLIIFYVVGEGRLELRLFGLRLMRTSDTSRTLFYLLIAVVARLCVAYPRFLRARAPSLVSTVREGRRGEAFWIGLAWAALGFCGSLGVNFGFHRLLYDSVPLFRGIRAPGRWSMIAYVGLALLAGLGARRLAEAVRARRASWLGPAAVYALVAAALLFELRAAPLELVRGRAEPDELSLRLRETPMRGGIVGLPYGENEARYYYVLRAADHARPLITGSSGFMPPFAWQIEQLSGARPIPARLLDLLEEIPASYVVVYYAYLPQARRPGLESFLAQAVAAGRLRYIRGYGEGDERQDLYAVTKTEPDARAETGVALPPFVRYDGPPGEEHLGLPSNDPHYLARQLYSAVLGREPAPPELQALASGLAACADSACRRARRARLTLDLLRSDEFREGGFRVFNLYRAAFGREPTYAEFRAALRQLNSAPRADGEAFVRLWLEGEEARRRFPPGLTHDEFVARAASSSGPRERADLARRLERRETTRAAVLLAEAERLAAAPGRFDAAFVVMQYFAHLRRDPEPGGDAPWRRVLASGGEAGYIQMIEGFLGSPEYADKFGAP